MKKKFQNLDHAPTNREKKQIPGGKLFWCGGCDANMVGKGEKCSVCGWRSPTKRHKISKSQ